MKINLAGNDVVGRRRSAVAALHAGAKRDAVNIGHSSAVHSYNVYIFSGNLPLCYQIDNSFRVAGFGHYSGFGSQRQEVWREIWNAAAVPRKFARVLLLPRHDGMRNAE
jgi:hypothetical protein